MLEFQLKRQNTHCYSQSEKDFTPINFNRNNRRTSFINTLNSIDSKTTSEESKENKEDNFEKKEVSISISDLPSLDNNENNEDNKKDIYSNLPLLLFYIFKGLIGGVIINDISNYEKITLDMVVFSLFSPLIFYYTPNKLLTYISDDKIKKILYILGYFCGLTTRVFRFYFTFIFKPQDIHDKESLIFSIVSLILVIFIMIFYMYISKNRVRNFVAFFSFIFLLIITLLIYLLLGGKIYI